MIQNIDVPYFFIYIIVRIETYSNTTMKIGMTLSIAFSIINNALEFINSDSSMIGGICCFLSQQKSNEKLGNLIRIHYR